MAATDKPYRKQKTLDIVFAVSCLLMLLSVLWMLVADYNREFKAVQRSFRDVESVLNERQMLAQLPDPADVAAAQNAGRGSPEGPRRRQGQRPRQGAGADGQARYDHGGLPRDQGRLRLEIELL